MLLPDQENAESAISSPSVNRIRVETALSRFPIHHLAKRQSVAINLQSVGENGEPDFKWEVTYNQKYGQPGPLAYKVDTLIVNRRIDEAGRPLPGVIKLGSLSALCVVLGLTDSGENRASIRKAIHQNASAYITAKIRYRTKTGKERWSEIGYNRYSVVFTGEMLPDGTVADAVYIIPTPSYGDLLNHVEVRPLDYDYLSSLTPGAQRFYELLSFQVFGALAGGRPRAKLLYSDYCKQAPQSRYHEFDQVKKQMFKIHAPHRAASYIAKIEYQTAVDGEGAPDWEMLYTPGSRAVGEFEAFTRKKVRSAAAEQLSLLAPDSTSPGPGGVPTEPDLLAQMICRGIAERKGRELLGNLKPGQDVLDQLEYVDILVAKDSLGKLNNPPGLYVMHVRDNVNPPQDFCGSRKRKLLEQAQDQKRNDRARAAQLKLEYEAYCDAEATRYINEMPRDEYEQSLDRHRRRNRQLFRDKAPEELQELSASTVWSEVRHQGPLKLLTYGQFASSNTDTAAVGEPA